MRVERPMKSKQVVCFISSPPREQLRHAHAAALTPALTGGCHGDDLLKSLYKSLYKNAKDPTLSILGHHGGRRKVASLRPPFSTPATPRDKPEPAGPFPSSIERAPPLFVRIPVAGGLKFGQMGSASPTYRSWLPLWRWLPLLLLFISTR